MFMPGQPPKVRPQLVHPSHKATIWKLDKDKTQLNTNLNVLTEIHYDSANPIEFVCQYRVPKFDSLERLQVSRVQGLFIKDVRGYLLAHRDTIVKEGVVTVEKGDLLKSLNEVKSGLEQPMDVFVSDVIPIGQYDIAYLYKIQIEDRELDETSGVPVSAQDPQLADTSDPENIIPQIGPRI